MPAKSKRQQKFFGRLVGQGQAAPGMTFEETKQMARAPGGSTYRLPQVSRTSPGYIRKRLKGR